VKVYLFSRSSSVAILYKTAPGDFYHSYPSLPSSRSAPATNVHPIEIGHCHRSLLRNYHDISGFNAIRFSSQLCFFLKNSCRISTLLNWLLNLAKNWIKTISNNSKSNFF
jgi:hypothetical protein